MSTTALTPFTGTFPKDWTCALCMDVGNAGQDSVFHSGGDGFKHPLHRICFAALVAHKGERPASIPCPVCRYVIVLQDEDGNDSHVQSAPPSDQDPASERAPITPVRREPLPTTHTGPSFGSRCFETAKTVASTALDVIGRISTVIVDSKCFKIAKKVAFVALYVIGMISTVILIGAIFYGVGMLVLTIYEALFAIGLFEALILGLFILWAAFALGLICSTCYDYLFPRTPLTFLQQNS